MSVKVNSGYFFSQKEAYQVLICRKTKGTIAYKTSETKN